MGKKKKSLKYFLCFAVMFSICAVLIGDFTLYVNAAEPETCTTFFDTDGGECEVESITVKKGESLILPPATLEGFHFLGWLERIVNEDGSHTFQVWPAGRDYTPKEDGPLYAVWKVVVTFEAGDGECDKTEIMGEPNVEITLPEAVCEGYEFTGWYKDGGLQEYVGGAGEGYLPERNVTLYAGWKEKEKPKFTITFNAGGGECGETAVSVEQGDAITLPDAAREGFEFTGWYKDEALNEYVGRAGEGYVPDGDSNFYAGWKAVGNEGEEGDNTGNGGNKEEGDNTGDGGNKEEGDNTGTGENDGDGGNEGEGGNTENPPAVSDTDGAGSTDEAGGVSENKVYYLDTDVSLSSGYAEANEENAEVAEEVSADGVAAADAVSAQAERYGAPQDMGRMAEPVIQTGRMPLIPAAVVIGVYGALLVAAACVPGKKKKRDGKK